MILWILQRPLAWDEIEFLRATDWVGQGRVPYREFWEHHSPLQWFLFAPIARLVRSAKGVSPVLVLRWAQLPAWGLTLWYWARSTSEKECDWLTPALTGLLLCSPAFLLFAVEYRVDGLASMLFLFGVLFSQGRRAQVIFGGFLLAAVPLANLRLGPQAALGLVLLTWADLDHQKWRWNGRSAPLLAGAGACALLALSYGIATGSLGLAWQQLIVDNQLVASLSSTDSRAFWPLIRITVEEQDPLPALLLVGGVWGAIKALGKVRHPTFFQICATMFLANLAFVYALNTHYFYHFQTLLLLAVPLVAHALRTTRFPSSRLTGLVPGLAFLGLWGLVIQAQGFLHTRAEGRLAYQNELLRSVEELTQPGEKVWDGCGFALRRDPAYTYWFLPVHARLLARTGRFAPLTVESFKRAAPSVVLLNARTFNWIHEWPELGTFIQANYLPIRPHLWIPAPNGRLLQNGDALTWRILRSNKYRVIAYPALATHPYFQAPFLYLGVTTRTQSPGLTVDTEASFEPCPVTLRINQKQASLVDGGVIQLAQGDRLDLQSKSSAPLGVFVVPQSVKKLFLPAPVADGPDAPLYRYF